MKRLLESILKEEVRNFSYLNTKLVKDKFDEKGQMVDILVLVNDKIVNIELNLKFDKEIKIRNFNYSVRILLGLSKKGKNFKDLKVDKVVQANLNFGTKESINEENVYLYSEEKKEKYLDNFIIKNYNIDKYKEKYYNKEELTKDELIFAILDLPLEELEKLSLEDDLVMEYKELLEKINSQEPFIYDVITEEEEEYYREIGLEEARKEGLKLGIEEGIQQGIEQGIEQGIKQGKEENKIEVAKKLLQKNMPIDFISEVTNLDEKTIEKLKRN